VLKSVTKGVKEANMDTTKLSQSDLTRVNIGKKRKYQPNNTKDSIAKLNKAKGNPYRGRNGHFNPGIQPPQQVLRTHILIILKYFVLGILIKRPLLSNVV
jgi:hypothetical protein